jgi:hypothetical protein
MLRGDAAIARLGVRLCGIQGVRTTMADLMPWPTKDEEVAPPATPAQVLSFLKSRVKRKD